MVGSARREWSYGQIGAVQKREAVASNDRKKQ